jgi:hypothetical protein
MRRHASTVFELPSEKTPLLVTPLCKSEPSSAERVDSESGRVDRWSEVVTPKRVHAVPPLLLLLAAPALLTPAPAGPHGAGRCTPAANCAGVIDA